MLDVTEFEKTIDVSSVVLCGKPQLKPTAKYASLAQ